MPQAFYKSGVTGEDEDLVGFHQAGNEPGHLPAVVGVKINQGVIEDYREWFHSHYSAQPYRKEELFLCGSAQLVGGLGFYPVRRLDGKIGDQIPRGRCGGQIYFFIVAGGHGGKQFTCPL